MPAINYASKYAQQVDERFHKESQAALALNNDYKFSGVKTVNVYSIPVVGMNDYQRSGTGRYGSPNDLSTNVQELTIKRDRAFTYIIDKGDKEQTQMVLEAGKSLSRQLREVVIPEYDTYAFKVLAAAASEKGGYDTTAITKANAYEMFLKGMEYLGDNNVPDAGRVCFCTYKFYNLLKQDSAFVKYGNASQEMLKRGELGEVDGCKIVRVASSRLPAGAAFLITHKCAACGPKQLNEHKIHDDPPGISGWLVEGRMLYDIFVLNEKAKAIYYHGSQPVLKNLIVGTAATATGKSTVQVLSEKEGSKRYYVTAATASALTAVTYGTAITTDSWKELTANEMEITPTSGHTIVRVVEVDSANKPIAVGDAVLNIG